MKKSSKKTEATHYTTLGRRNTNWRLLLIVVTHLSFPFKYPEKNKSTWNQDFENKITTGFWLESKL